MGPRGRTTMNLMVGLAVTTFVTSLLELIAARYASSVTLTADAIHMLLDAFVYTLNLIAEYKSQKFHQARSFRMSIDKTRSPSPRSPEPESEKLLAPGEIVCELFSPRILEADAEEAFLAASVNRWQSASALATGVLLLGSAVTVCVASIMKLTYAARGSRQAMEMDGNMDLNFVFLTGLMSLFVHTGALAMFFCHPELQHLHHTPTLCFSSSALSRRRSARRGHHRHGDIHLSATLFHVISDALENIGLIVVLILVRIELYHPAIVDAAASVAISCAIFVVAGALLIKAVPAFHDSFCKKTISEEIPVSPTFAKSYRRQGLKDAADLL